MKSNRRRVVLAFAVLFVFTGSITFARRLPAAGSLSFAISFPTARSEQPVDGRVLLFISADGKTEPRTQTDQYRANSTQPIFGVDVDGLKPGQEVRIDESVWGWPLKSI